MQNVYPVNKYAAFHLHDTLDISIDIAIDIGIDSYSSLSFFWHLFIWEFPVPLIMKESKQKQH